MIEKLSHHGVYLKVPAVRKKHIDDNKKFFWHRTQISKMLRNETYIGNVVSGKRTQVSPKVKKGKVKPKNEYIIVKNMHEPIIDNELWQKTQERLAQNTAYTFIQHKYLLKGITYCGKCGGEIIFQSRKQKLANGNEKEYVIARCENKYKYESKCSNSSVGEKALLNIIKEAVIKEIEKINYSKEEIVRLYYNAKKRKNIGDEENNINDILSKIKKIDNKVNDLYFQKLDETITLEQYNFKKKTLLDEKEELEEILEKKKPIIDCKNSTILEIEEKKRILKLYKKFLKEEIPSKQMIQELIEKIIVTDKSVEIEFKHKNLGKEIQKK